ncbi:glycosyltransferase [Bacillus spongiae]|uniref:Glycosyltransferase n=1 Tax=Bacillus spongiae TaxID=2683610 RepID=A0ABU8HFA6_9BACI
MKKVLIMVSSMEIGGVEKSLLNLLSSIPKGKYDITLLLLEKKGGFLSYVPDWVKVREVDWYKQIKPIIMQPPQTTIHQYFIKKDILKIPGFLWGYYISKKLEDRSIYYHQVFKSIANEPLAYDVAISYQSPTDILDYYVANKVIAKKKISWIHFDVTKHKINQKLYSKLHKNFERIFVVSHEARKKLIQKLPDNKEKTEVFFNLISPNLIEQMSRNQVDFDEQFDGMKIVTVGRLSKEKGQDLAIKVLSRLKKTGYNVKWYCVGEGKNREEYEHLIKEYDLKNEFVLLGATPNPYPYIAKADIYVQTSRHEGYCLTLAEAKCLHKPIITTNFTGAREQIIHNQNGLIAEFDEEDLYIKIKDLIENKQKREKLIRNVSLSKVNTKLEVHKLFTYIEGESEVYETKD